MIEAVEQFLPARLTNIHDIGGIGEVAQQPRQLAIIRGENCNRDARHTASLPLRQFKQQLRRARVSSPVVWVCQSSMALDALRTEAFQPAPSDVTSAKMSKPSA